MTRRERRLLVRQQRKEEHQNRQRHRGLRRLIIWLIVIAAIGGSSVGLVALDKKYGSSPSSTASVAAITADEWTRGPESAPVTLIEYSDLQCPACKFYQPILKQLVEKYPDKLRFVYRHFPLRSIHKNADLAARHAEAAGKQGKFWEFHDLLFENQTSWANEGNPRTAFERYAGQLGLNLDQLKQDADSQTAKDAVKADERGALAAGVKATPTFFLNGKRIQNPGTLDEFAKLIDEALGLSPTTNS